MDGRVALITGAAGDLGRATALLLASEGAAIVACDLGAAAAKLDDTVDACRKITMDRAGEASPRPALSVAFDITDGEAVAAAIDRVVADVGPPDAVFNNAGYQGAFANTVGYDAQDFSRVLDINVVGAFNVLRSCSEALIAAERAGAIVNTASMVGKEGNPKLGPYSASKAAVIGMTKSAAADLAADSIRVNAISPAFIGPGAMWTRQVELQAEVPSQYYPDDASAVAEAMIGAVPLRRYGTLDEVASGALFLLSDDASYLTGFNLEIAGGIR